MRELFSSVCDYHTEHRPTLYRKAFFICCHFPEDVPVERTRGGPMVSVDTEPTDFDNPRVLNLRGRTSLTNKMHVSGKRLLPVSWEKPKVTFYAITRHSEAWGSPSENKKHLVLGFLPKTSLPGLQIALQLGVEAPNSLNLQL